MPREKLVDGDFLGRLMQGSYEAAMGGVEEAVNANASLFGGDDSTEVSTIATYKDRVVVANSEGQFFRASWGMNEDEGTIELSDVEEMDVPVYEADAMGAQVREHSRETVDALLKGDPSAEDKLRELAEMAHGGVRLTTEGVEDYLSKLNFEASDWHQAVMEHESTMRGFIGAEAARLSYPKTRFKDLAEAELSEDQIEGYRDGARHSLQRLSEALGSMQDRIALGREITESHTYRGSDNTMAAADFVEFVQDFADDLDEAVGVVGDALAVSDGDVLALTRIHDEIAEGLYEWALASAFVEKLARKFEAPSEAA